MVISLFLFILAIVLGLIVVMMIDKKMSDVTINMPNIKVPSPNVKVNVKKENIKKKVDPAIPKINKRTPTPGIAGEEADNRENKKSQYENFVDMGTGNDIPNEYLDNAMVPAKNNNYIHAYNGIVQYKSV